MDEQETLARIRLAAQVTRNSAAPHCHPITILVLTLAIGTIFIGMTMTIVAHWPGSVSVGFDPLSIPGPIILTLGGLFFIFGSALVCYFQRKENKRKGEKFVSFATALSRMNLETSHHNRQGSQLLDREIKKEKNKKDDSGLSYELDDLNNVKVQRQLDEVIASTVSALDLESSLPGNDEEHLPLPVRTKKIKSDFSKVKENIKDKIREINEGDDANEPFLTSGDKTKSKVRTKTKKINTNYSRDVLEGRRSPGEEENPHRRHHHQEKKYDLNSKDDDDDPGHALKIHVKAAQGTSVSIQQYEQESDTFLSTGKKKKSKKLNAYSKGKD